jgi:hypothetical protein
MDKLAWDEVESLTERLEQYRYQGVDVKDLYRQIVAAARFIDLIRRELVPGLRHRIALVKTSGSDKVMQDMAVNNFNSNLQVFADLVNELYIRLVELDKAQAKGHIPIYAQIPELGDVGAQLIGG